MLNQGDGDTEDPFQVVGEEGSINPSSSPVGSAAMSADSPIVDSPIDVDFARRQPIVKGAKQIYSKLDKPFWSATPPIGFPEVRFDDTVIQTELAIPPHLLKPEFQGGLGKSKLDANGLQ